MTDSELDALVAEKVFGETMPDTVPVGELQAHLAWVKADPQPCWFAAVDEDHAHRWFCKRFSTLMEDAWEVVEQLRKNFVVEITTSSMPVGKVCVAVITHGYEVAYVISDTAPRAICLAALKAVGAEVPA